MGRASNAKAMRQTTPNEPPVAAKNRREQVKTAVVVIGEIWIGSMKLPWWVFPLTLTLGAVYLIWTWIPVGFKYGPQIRRVSLVAAVILIAGIGVSAVSFEAIAWWRASSMRLTFTGMNLGTLSSKDSLSTSAVVDLRVFNSGPPSAIIGCTLEARIPNTEPITAERRDAQSISGSARGKEGTYTHERSPELRGSAVFASGQMFRGREFFLFRNTPRNYFTPGTKVIACCKDGFEKSFCDETSLPAVLPDHIHYDSKK